MALSCPAAGDPPVTTVTARTAALVGAGCAEEPGLQMDMRQVGLFFLPEEHVQKRSWPVFA